MKSILNFLFEYLTNVKEFQNNSQHLTLTQIEKVIDDNVRTIHDNFHFKNHNKEIYKLLRFVLTWFMTAIKWFQVKSRTVKTLCAEY